MTKQPRKPSAAEEALFRSAFEDARPLKVRTPRARNKSPAKSAPVKSSPAPNKSRDLPLPGLDGRTAERLRRGTLEPQARLDLHGLTETLAHAALVAFVRTAHARGLRLILVVTGKGARPAPEDKPFDLELHSRTRGVLKSLTPRWLREPDIAPLIADLKSAHRKHGGTGALYVYLRKVKRD